MKILILFGHPAFQYSTVNKKMTEEIEKLGNVTFHDLYEAYPEMDIDIDREQELLQQHDCIIFQHPMYWYSTPAIFKEWQDLVLEHGWAYGQEGNKLKGKYFFNAITTGSPKIAFSKDQFQGHTLREFLVPFEQMSKLCGMISLPPFAIHATHIAGEEELLIAKQHYHLLLSLLSDNMIDLEQAKQKEYLNDLLN